MAKPKYAGVLTESFLKQRYLEEKRSTNFISAETGIEKTNVRNYLRRYGIPLRTSAESIRVSVDWQGFEELSTDWHAYWAGFIAADGCVFAHGGSARVQVILKATDDDHLRDLQLGLKTKVPVTLYNGQRNVAKLIIYNWDLVTALAKWGIVPNKTLTMPWPAQLPTTAIPAYIRGYFDGDGTIYQRYRSAPGTTWTETVCRFISGSVPFLEGLQQELKSRGIETRSTYRNQQSSAFILPISSRRENLLAFAELLYHDCTVCLERKRTVFREMEDYHAARPRTGSHLRYQTS
jgi:intein/homing endonuclease